MSEKRKGLAGRMAAKAAQGAKDAAERCGNVHSEQGRRDRGALPAIDAVKAKAEDVGQAVGAKVKAKTEEIVEDVVKTAAKNAVRDSLGMKRK